MLIIGTCRSASGYSSAMATVHMIPATHAKTFSNGNLPVRSIASAKTAPNGSASPELLASQKASHGESGLAAIQGTAIAIPSGMLCINIPMATVTPS